MLRHHPAHLPRRSAPCYSPRKPKGPVLENTTGQEVAAPTYKRGFVMPKFERRGVSRVAMVTGKMGHTARLAARLVPCFQHLAHPLCLKTQRVVLKSRQGATTMTKVITLVRASAPIQSTTDTTDPEIIRLHGLAENALATALHELRRLDASPESLQRATARAVRGATLLRRASACTTVREG